MPDELLLERRLDIGGELFRVRDHGRHGVLSVLLVSSSFSFPLILDKRLFIPFFAFGFA